MKTLSIELPDDLDARLSALAERRGEDPARLVLSAVQALVASEPPAEPPGDAIPDERGPILRPRPGSVLERVWDLVGSVDLPHTDLSTNKAHMEGFGQ